jgi:hypothetical protein
VTVYRKTFGFWSLSIARFDCSLEQRLVLGHSPTMIQSSGYLLTTGSLVLLLSLVATAFRLRGAHTARPSVGNEYRISSRNSDTQCIASERPVGPEADSYHDGPVAIQKGRDTVCRALEVPDDVVKTVTKRP